MRVLISLSSLHRVRRGAEIALESIAQGLAERGHTVTIYGSGQSFDHASYAYRRLPVIGRERFERWPSTPPFRDPTTYEAATFVPGLITALRPSKFDVTMTCGFPAENIALRRPALFGHRPAHVFVTQNGDWPAQLHTGESRAFSCDGLVCTNPVYLERNRDRWNCALIPNGVDVSRFHPGPPARQRLGLPLDKPVVLMVSALIASKRVEQAIRAVAELDGAVLLVAGDGPLRRDLAEFGHELLGDRYVQRTFTHDDMPDLYRSADVLVHTTLIESFGNIYVEAMASGLQVVAHRSPATEWTMGSSEGLVDTDDSAQLTAALEAAIRCGPGETEHRRVQVVDERFTWPIVAEKYSQFLESACARRSGVQ